MLTVIHAAVERCPAVCTLVGQRAIIDSGSASVFNLLLTHIISCDTFAWLVDKFLDQSTNGRDQRQQHRTQHQSPMDRNTVEPVADLVVLRPSKIRAVPLTLLTRDLREETPCTLHDGGICDSGNGCGHPSQLRYSLGTKNLSKEASARSTAYILGHRRVDIRATRVLDLLDGEVVQDLEERGERST